MGLRAFLFGIILLTIPCYIIGGLALFLAPPPRGLLAQNGSAGGAQATATPIASRAIPIAASPTRAPALPAPSATSAPKPTLAPTHTALPAATLPPPPLPPTPLPPTFTAFPSPTTIQTTPIVTSTVILPTFTAVPLPTNTPARRLVTVPQVIGMEEKAAIKAVEAAGLQVRQVIKRKIPGYPENRVWSQSLAPGTQVFSGTMLDLIVASK